MSALVTGLQFLSALVFSLIVGSVFSIWRGYNPAAYSPATFVEVHQGAVRGLNVLLPVLGLTSILLVAALAFHARAKGPIFWLYMATLLLMIGAAVVTRFFNQPINANVMTWTAPTMPADWSRIRDTWWNWHLARTALTILAMVTLLAAILRDKLPGS